jgi:hypothetical protein
VKATSAKSALLTIRLARTEATCGLTSYGGAVLVVSALATVKLGDGDWFRGYSDPFNSVLTGSVFLAPLLCGIVGLRCQQLVRTGVLALSSSAPRGVRGALRVVVTAMAGWAAVALGIAVVIALAHGVLVGFEWWSLTFLVLAIANIAAAGAIGVACGVRSQAPFAPALVSLVVFGVPYVLAYSSSWLARLSFIYNTISYPAELQPRLSLVGVQVAIDVLVAAFAWTLVASSPTLGRHWSIAPISLIPGVGIVAGVAGLALLGANPVALRAMPAHPSCQSREAVQVCVWPQDAAYEPIYMKAVAELRSDVGNEYPLPSRFAEPGLYGRQLTGRGVLISPVHPVGEASFVDALADAMVPASPCAHPSRVALQAQGRLRTFIALNDAELTPDGRHVAKWIATLGTTAAAQRAWVAEEMTDVRECA